MILESQGKYEDAAKIIDGPLGSLCKISSERERMLICFLIKSNQFDRVEEICKNSLLNSDPDDWLCHTSLLDAFTKNLEIFPNLFDEKIKGIMSFYDHLQTKVAHWKNGKRGPFMGRLLLFSKTNQFGLIHELIFEYIKQFGTALSCFEDISPYLSHVPVSSRPGLISSLMEIYNPLLENTVDIIGQTRININIKKIIRFYNHKLDVKETFEEVQSLLTNYYKSLPLGIIHA